MEGVSLRIAKELASRGHSIALGYCTDGDMLPTYSSFCSSIMKLELEGFQRRRPISTAGMILKLNRLIRLHDIDAVYTSHLGYIAVGSILRLMNGRPWHYHLGLPGTGSRSLTRWATALVGSGICPAEHTLKSWREVGWPSDRLWQVRNWVDGDEFRPACSEDLRAKLGVPVDAFCISYVGRIVREKGVEVLAEAFRGLDSSAFLVLAGRVEPEYLNQIVSLCGDARRVLVLPRTDRVQDIFSMADVVCVPSIWPEPLPLVVLEAMATATPVIVSDAGMLPSLIGDDFVDLVVGQGSVESLLDRLSYVQENLDSLRDRAGRLRARALQTFGPQQPVDEYERIILGSIRSGEAAH